MHMLTQQLHLAQTHGHTAETVRSIVKTGEKLQLEYDCRTSENITAVGRVGLFSFFLFK